jgi:hypothetical protein
VTTTEVAVAPPVPIGGEIPAGTYVLTASTLYTGAGGKTGPTDDKQRITVQVDALDRATSTQRSQLVQSQPGEGCPENRETLTAKYVSTTEGVSSLTCPVAAQTDHSVQSHSVEGTAIIVFDTRDGQVRTMTFTRQPD